MQQTKIKITQTETEYRLFIPRGQKERARNIKGRPQRNWNGNGKYWFYPRSIRMYKALKEEFGDDLTASSSFTPPQSFDERETEKEEQELELQKQIAQLNKTLSKINPTGEVNESIKSLREMLSARDEEIQSLKDRIQEINDDAYETDMAYEEQLSRIEKLEGEIKTREKTIDELRQGLSKKEKITLNQKREIQRLSDAVDKLNRRNDKLTEQVNEGKAIIGNLRQTLSEKEGKISNQEDEIKSLQAENRQKDRNIAQHRNINTHPGIRDIVVETTGNDPAFGKYFRELDIDTRLPEELRNWLIRQLRTNPKSRDSLTTLILECKGNRKFNEFDIQLAHTIRTQRNLIAYQTQEVDDRTMMGRALCCLFAAALLTPKLSKPDHTSTSTKPIKLKSNDAETHYNRGLDYVKERNHDRAIEAYTKAIQIKSDYVDAYLCRGNAYHDKGDYDRAIKDYNQAIRLNPKNADAYLWRASVYDDKGDYDRAIADYTKAIQLKPDDAEAYRSRGYAHEKKGDHTRAQADFDKVKQLQK